MEFKALSAFRGINNRLPADRLRALGDRDPGSFVRDAVNVDLTGAGSFQRRAGRERIGEYTGCRGLFEHGGEAFFAAQDRLMRIRDDGSITEIGVLGSAYSQVAFAETPMGLVVSDTYRMRLIVGDSTDPLVPYTPNPVPELSAGSGALPAGQYAVMFFTETATGLRSAGTYPKEIEIAEGGAVAISAAPRSNNLAVFMTAADGEIFYRVGTMGPAQTSLSVAAAPGDGEGLAYKPTLPLYAGEILMYHRGRLYSAVGHVIHFSEPYQLGMSMPGQDYIPFDGPITLMASIDEGMFIATASQTFFMVGSDPQKTQIRQLAPFGAIPGTLVRKRNSNEWMWHSPRGPVHTKGNDIELLQDGVIAYENANRGASLIREENGLRSLVTTLAGTIPAGAAVAGSYMDAEVITGA